MNFITKWKDKITEYVEVRVQLAKLSFIERTSHILGYLVFTFVVLSLLLPILIFLGIGLSEFFAELIDSRMGGYFMTFGVYVICLLILVSARKSIINRFATIFIAKLSEADEDDKPKEDNK